MGNASTREERGEPRRPRRLNPRNSLSASNSGPNSPANPPSAEGPSQQVYGSRTGRGSRADLAAFLGIHQPEDAQSLETKRELKEEREAMRQEKQRTTRLRERERSMREEHVDGGYLVTQGVYTGVEDYDKGVVRQLMIERRLAPFWRGLNDYNDSWTENQLIAAARGLPIPAADEIPRDEDTGPFAKPSQPTERGSTINDNSLTVPISSRSPSYSSESSATVQGSTLPPLPAPDLPQTFSSSGFFRSRAKPQASLTIPPVHSSETATPTEIQLPRDPYINGQRIEVYLYKETFECPICLIYYPAYGNKTRCCDQWICSECFVQIKRADPHPPEHVEPAVPSAPMPLVERPREEGVDRPREGSGDGELVSEPASCPFCKQLEFGITYEPPPFRRGLAYANQSASERGASAMSSTTSLNSGLSGGQLSPNAASRRRTISVSATDSAVITTDKVRPKWIDKLANARERVNRDSARASALHAAAYDRDFGEGRSFGAFSRRGLLRRGSGSDVLSNSNAHASMMALLSERHGGVNRIDGHAWTPTGPGAPVAPPRGSSRRNRVDDIEEMMMMEAIRQSLAAEVDRQKQEDKTSKKESKKAEKEAKKKEKAEEKAAKKAEKSGVYKQMGSASAADFPLRSDSSLEVPESSSAAANRSQARRRAGTDPFRDPSPSSTATTNQGRSETDLTLSHPLAYDPQSGNAQSHLELARARLDPQLSPSSQAFESGTYRSSHLRTTSNISSASSLNDSPPGSTSNPFLGSSSSLGHSPNASVADGGLASSTSEGRLSHSPQGGSASLEPMLNFRSLAEMIGKDDTTSRPDPPPPGDPIGPPPLLSETIASSNTAPEERHNEESLARRSDEYHDTAEYPLANVTNTPRGDITEQASSAKAQEEDSGKEPALQ
ncbi:MAG: hypothetical protein Q9174_004322 [Haloplaca sp. 1 TL-2023]